MVKTGTISFFGGSSDSFMRNCNDPGLSFYEHHECDLRPDLFFPKSTDPTQKTWERLRNSQSFYIALNIPNNLSRDVVHKSFWKVENIKTNQWVLANLVDRGPSADGRLVDASDAIKYALRLNEDDEVNVSELTNFEIPFGIYGERI